MRLNIAAGFLRTRRQDQSKNREHVGAVPIMFSSSVAGLVAVSDPCWRRSVVGKTFRRCARIGPGPIASGIGAAYAGHLQMKTRSAEPEALTP
jgi:hypothetical protein